METNDLKIANGTETLYHIHFRGDSTHITTQSLHTLAVHLNQEKREKKVLDCDCC